MKEHVVQKNLISTYWQRKDIYQVEDAEETLNLFGIITNNIFSTIENEKVADVAFSELFEQL